jgi:hypothetical protein
MRRRNRKENELRRMAPGVVGNQSLLFFILYDLWAGEERVEYTLSVPK